MRETKAGVKVVEVTVSVVEVVRGVVKVVRGEEGGDGSG